MCLSTITWQAVHMKNAKSPVKWQKGFKLFRADGDYYKFPYFSPAGVPANYLYGSKEKELYIELDKKYTTNPKDTTHIRSNEDNKSYKAGFHIFPSITAALFFQKNYGTWALFEVQYRRIMTEGTHSVHTDYPVDCVIANEMIIKRKLEHSELEDYNKIVKKVRKSYMGSTYKTRRKIKKEAHVRRNKS